MPRQIIDVESSRPAYIRRNVTLAVLVIVIVAVAVYFFVAQRGTVPTGAATQQTVPAHNPAAKPPGK